jgi:hypothetical protein
MRRNQENIVVGQVLDVGNNEDDEEEARDVDSTNEDPTSSNKSLCGLKRKVTIAVIVILAVVAVIVGVVVAMSSNSAASPNSSSDSGPLPTVESLPVDLPTTVPTDLVTPAPTSLVEDWSNSCDLSSSSLAKRLPCHQDRSKLSIAIDCFDGVLMSFVWILVMVIGLALNCGVS